MKLLFILILLLALSFPTFADFSGRVVGVSDGDTIKVLHDGNAEKIRLNGIDCPEKKQPFGQRAKAFTSEKAFGQTVTIKEYGTDKYGRTIGDVTLPDGSVLNQLLVKEGLAWWYRKYSQDQSLRTMEEEAKSARRGLWADQTPMAPWDWRKAIRKEGPE